MVDRGCIHPKRRGQGRFADGKAVVRLQPHAGCECDQGPILLSGGSCEVVMVEPSTAATTPATAGGEPGEDRARAPGID